MTWTLMILIFTHYEWPPHTQVIERFVDEAACETAGKRTAARLTDLQRKVDYLCYGPLKS